MALEAACEEGALQKCRGRRSEEFSKKDVT